MCLKVLIVYVGGVLGGTAGTHRMHPISWNVLCQPKKTGGLGIRRAMEVNNALLAKLIWGLNTEIETPWVRLLKEKYNMATLQGCDVRVDPAASFIWKFVGAKAYFLKEWSFGQDWAQYIILGGQWLDDTPLCLLAD